MSDFIAKITAELDTSKIRSQIQNEIEKNTTVTLSKFTINTSNLQSQIQNALDKNKFTINLAGIDTSNISNQMRQSGSTAGKNFTESFNSSLSSITTTTNNAANTIQHMQQTLANMKFDRSSIDLVTKDLQSMSLAISNVTTKINGNSLNISVRGIDELGRAVTIVKEFDYESGRISTVGKTISQSFDTGATAAKRFEESVRKATTALNSGSIESSIAKVTAQYEKLGSTGHAKLSEIKSDIQTLTVLQNKMSGAKDGAALVSAYEQFNSTLASVKNNLSTVSAEAGQVGNSLGNTLRGAFTGIAKYISVSTVIYQSINALKQMANNVLEVDTAMTELYRVTDLTTQQYEELYKKMTASAKEYGSALSDIISSTASWVRLGFDTDDAERLSEITAMYQHVTDLDESTAVENLVTAYKGFQSQLLELTDNDVTSAVEYIADIFDKLGNEFSVTAADVGNGLTNCASALELAGNTIQQSSAMLTGITEVTQDASKAGNALKTLSLRLRGTTAQELEALGEDTEGLIEVTSTLQDKIKQMTGVDLVDETNQLRSTYDVMNDLAGVWQELDTNTQANVLETIAGRVYFCRNAQKCA